MKRPNQRIGCKVTRAIGRFGFPGQPIQTSWGGDRLVSHFGIEYRSAIQSHAVMKFLPLFAFSLLTVIACQGQAIYPPPPSPSTPLAAPAFTNTANFAIQIQWRTSKSETNFLRLVTTEGLFSLDTVQTNRVKINNNEIPVSLRFSGTLTVIGPEKGRLNLFLGRTVPYVTGVNLAGGATSSTYQQMQAGLNSNYTVTFGKPMVIQSDGNEEITLLVTKLDD
jgi:hypothetical protein